MNFNGGYPLAGTVNSEVNCLLYMLNINMHIVMMTSTFAKEFPLRVFMLSKVTQF